jgi:hypothetical protein
MNSRNAWASGVKRRLEQAGFEVRLANPTLAVERKRVSRRRDAGLISRGIASSQQLQRKNSLFAGRAKRFRIVDYGGLDEGK